MHPKTTTMRDRYCMNHDSKKKNERKHVHESRISSFMKYQALGYKVGLPPQETKWSTQGEHSQNTFGLLTKCSPHYPVPLQNRSETLPFNQNSQHSLTVSPLFSLTFFYS